MTSRGECTTKSWKPPSALSQSWYNLTEYVAFFGECMGWGCRGVAVGLALGVSVSSVRVAMTRAVGGAVGLCHGMPWATKACPCMPPTHQTKTNNTSGSSPYDASHNTCPKRGPTLYHRELKLCSTRILKVRGCCCRSHINSSPQYNAVCLWSQDFNNSGVEKIPR